MKLGKIWWRRNLMCSLTTILSTPPRILLASTRSKIDQLQLVPSGGDSGPRRTSTERKCSVIYTHPGPMSSASHVSQFLRLADDLNTANSAWIYPSVQITSQFLSHDWELVDCMESQWRSQYFSRSYWNFGQNNVAENDEAIFSTCHIWSRDVIDDVSR
jgi:hypothetical protein